MTPELMSNEFDLLYNNNNSALAPGLDEFEKSQFLTKSLYEILDSYFNPRKNKTLEGFDDSMKRLVDFSNLTCVFFENDSIEREDIDSPLFMDDRSQIFPFPSGEGKEPLYILSEQVRSTNDDGSYRTLNILPINYLLYNQLMLKPYKYPVKNLCWRLITSDASGEHRYVELIAPGTLTKYTVRYVRRPKPIILVNLTAEQGLEIDGENTKMGCELDESLHHDIVQRAVELAKASYNGDLNSVLALGLSSETDKGFVTSSK